LGITVIDTTLDASFEPLDASYQPEDEPQVSNIDPFVFPEDYIAPEIGENSFDYIEKWARKRQVLLASDADGNLLLTRPSGGGAIDKSAFIQHKDRNSGNNVLSYAASFNSTERFRRYIVTSQIGLVAANHAGETDIPKMTNQSSSLYKDTGVVRGRQLVLLAETAASIGENNVRARWERNVRKVRGRAYNCTVRGYKNQTGSLWLPGTLIYVEDEFAGIEQMMRVNTAIFHMGPEGYTTELELLEPNAYTLTLETSKEQEMGEGFICQDEPDSSEQPPDSSEG
jgi:prophage tail gpP-like protein